jgi:hypothetical protein
MSTSFALNLRALTEKAKGNGNLLVRKILLDVATSLVYKSPVGDADYWQSAAPKGYAGGRFRANWQFGADAPNIVITEDTDANGSATLGRIAASIPDKASGRVHYITNSLPYARRIEDGWSHRQAPRGVVGLTVIEFSDFVARASLELNK